MAVSDIDCILHLRALAVTPDVWVQMIESRDTFQPEKEKWLQHIFAAREMKYSLVTSPLANNSRQ